MSNTEGLSFADIHANLVRDLADLTTKDGQARLIETLALLNFEINRLKRKQRVYAAALRAQGVAINEELSSIVEHMPRQVVIDARDALDAIDGFYPLEYGEDAPYRWTGPRKDVRFRAWIDRSVPVALEMQVYSFGDVQNRNELELLVDGVSVPVVCGENIVRSDAFPVRETIAATEIVFEIPHAFCPKDNGEPDTRELRLAFSKIQLIALKPEINPSLPINQIKT